MVTAVSRIGTLSIDNKIKIKIITLSVITLSGIYCIHNVETLNYKVQKSLIRVTGILTY